MDENGAASPTQTIENITETLTRLDKTVENLAGQVQQLDKQLGSFVTRDEMGLELRLVREANQAGIATVDGNVTNAVAGLTDQISQIARSVRMNNEQQTRAIDNYTRDQAEVFAQFRADLKSDWDTQWQKVQEKVAQALVANEGAIKNQTERMDTHATRLTTLERIDEERSKRYAEIRTEQREQRSMLAAVQSEISDFLIRIVPVTDAVLGNRDLGMSPLRAEFEIVNKRVDEIKWIGRGGVVTVFVLVIGKLLGIDLGGVI